MAMMGGTKMTGELVMMGGTVVVQTYWAKSLE